MQLQPAWQLYRYETVLVPRAISLIFVAYCDNLLTVLIIMSFPLKKSIPYGKTECLHLLPLPDICTDYPYSLVETPLFRRKSLLPLPRLWESFLECWVAFPLQSTFF